jgi:hypothetical protein
LSVSPYRASNGVSVATRRAEDVAGAYVIANAAEACGCTVISIVYGPRLAYDDEGKPISSPKRFLRLFFSPMRDRYFCYHVFYRTNGVDPAVIDAKAEHQANILRDEFARLEEQRKSMN